MLLAIILVLSTIAYNAQGMQLPRSQETEISRIVQPDGKTLVLVKQKFLGQEIIKIYRYNIDNELDKTFGGAAQGYVSTIIDNFEPLSISLQSEGKILLETQDNRGYKQVMTFSADGMDAQHSYITPEKERLP